MKNKKKANKKPYLTLMSKEESEKLQAAREKDKKENRFPLSTYVRDGY